jgi:hypothetical protein
VGEGANLPKRREKVTEKFKFTQEDLDAMILAALNEEPAKENKKPNAIQALLAKSKLGKKE